MLKFEVQRYATHAYYLRYFYTHNKYDTIQKQISTTSS